MPLVSVIIPTYNQSSLLLETLESVRAQTIADFEIIVVDDGSTDETPARLAELVAREPRLRVIRQANAGTGAARNRGLDEARGTYIALLDHDDLWLPEKLQVQVQFLDAHPRCVACVVPLATSNDPSVSLLVREVDAARPDGIISRPFRRAAEKSPLFLTCSAIMFRRATAEGLRFGTERGTIEDVQFYVGLLARGALGMAGSEVLVIYRIHSTNTSRQETYYYRGIKLLRQLDRAGRFAGLSRMAYDDMHAWFGFVGRAALTTQLLCNQRLRGWETYLRELRYQARQRRVDVILAWPILAVLPARWIHRWYHRKG